MKKKETKYKFWLFVWRQTLYIRRNLVILGSNSIELGHRIEQWAHAHMMSEAKWAKERVNQGESND